MKNILAYCAVIAIAFGAGWISNEQYQQYISQHSLNEPVLEAETSSVKSENTAASVPMEKAPQKIDSANHFNQMLAAKNYAEAINLYNNIHNTNEKSASKLHKELVNHLQTLINNKHYRDAEELSRLYLDSFQSDISIWSLLSDAQIAQGYYVESLLNFYQARNSAMSQEEFDQITTAGRTVVKKIDDTLNQKGETFQLIALYNEFISMDGNSADFTYRLAELHQKVNQTDRAISLLESIETHPDFGEQAINLIAELTQETIPGAAIPIIRSGEHYIVQAYINDTQAINLMIDTGASISALSQSYYNDINHLTGFTFIRSLQINTASGEIKADMHQVETFSIEDYVLSDIKFVVLPFESKKDIHGLLGMNVLSQFDFTIDQQKSLLFLKPRKEKTK